MTAARHHPGTETPRDGITCPWEGYATPPPPHTHTQGSTGRAWPSWDSKPQALGQHVLTLTTLQGSVAHLGTTKGPSPSRQKAQEWKSPACRPREACAGKPASSAHTLGHMFTRMHARQYLSRPSWETQSSWLATLPSPRESKEKQERKPLGRQEGH